MEFYKKIKQKIEEELIQDEDDEDEEEEPPNGSFGDGENTNEYRSSRAENAQLRKEIATLKEHINRNYDVYVKRLEKRKAKIKEHEDNIKMVLSENEKLALKLKESEGYAQQLTECRESLEQLEGFQNQELAKVKHMLLSAETALELEKQERLKLRDQLEESKKGRSTADQTSLVAPFKHNQDATTNTLDTLEAPKLETEEIQDAADNDKRSAIEELRNEHEVVVNDLKNTISLLQAKVQNSSNNVKDSKSSQEDGETDSNVISIIETENKQLLRQTNELKQQMESMKLEHDKTTKELEEKNVNLKSKLKLITNERDNAKASLLELEIAKHECEEGLAKQDSDSKMKLVQLTTEKETLEVTLELREQELKSRKEELRQEQEKFKQELIDMEELSNAKGMQNSALQAELGNVKTQLSESNQSLHCVQNTLQTSQTEIEKLNKDVLSKQAIISNIEANLEQTNSKYEDLNCDFESLVTMNDKLEKDNSDLQEHISTLQSKCESLDNSNKELKSKCDKLASEVEILRNDISESERTFPERLENSDLVRSLKDQIVNLEDEVVEKKQVRICYNIREKDNKSYIEQAFTNYCVLTNFLLLVGKIASATSERHEKDISKGVKNNTW